MNDSPHDHDRPGIADMKAALHVTRVILNSADLKTTHEAVVAAGCCPACVAVAGISYGTTLASVMAGDEALMSEQTRLRLLAAVDAAERELGAAPN